MEAPPRRVGAGSSGQISCLRCRTALNPVGKKRLEGGSDTGFLGAIGELFAKREEFNVYTCPRCGHVEFFVAGVGEEARTQPAPSQQPVRSVLTTEETVEGHLHEASRHETHGDLEAAAARYEMVIAKYPGTTLARDSQDRLRIIQEKLGI
jgi:predicted nucleic-acid-binding Zn-ribbon protein